jgi:hypothetical protein
MKMSVFRHRQELRHIDHLECIHLATDDLGSNMILHASHRNATVLVPLEIGLAVIKPAEETDAHTCYEDLYDTAISVHQFEQMFTQKVKSPDDLAPQLFELELFMVQQERVRVRLRIKAKQQYEIGTLLSRLIREDKEFGKELQDRFTRELLNSDAASIDSAGALRINRIAPENEPLWRFVDLDDPDPEPEDD